MNGILLLGPDNVIESRARGHKVPVKVGELELSFEKTLIASPGVRVPWDLLPAAWGFLDRWDAAVPLWRYDVTAESAGTPNERELTRSIILDLRVLLHAVELLFVRRNQAGKELIAAWQQEMERGPERRLAFLRAFFTVKPRLCVLPISWLLLSTQQHRQWRGRNVPARNAGRPLVRVELEPGRFVKVHAGDEERAREHFERQRGGR